MATAQWLAQHSHHSHRSEILCDLETSDSRKICL